MGCATNTGQPMNAKCAACDSDCGDVAPYRSGIFAACSYVCALRLSQGGNRYAGPPERVPGVPMKRVASHG